MRPKDVVKRYVSEVLNGAGPARAEDLVSDESFRRRIDAFRSAFPDLEVTTHVLVAEGDLVAGHFTGRGTHEGLFHGVPPTSRRWRALCTAVFRVADGRIAEAWMNWDLLTLMEQLGAIERVRTVSA
jgi:predicted ester cyclase